MQFVITVFDPEQLDALEKIAAADNKKSDELVQLIVDGALGTYVSAIKSRVNEIREKYTPEEIQAALQSD